MSQEIALSTGLNQRPGFLDLNDPVFKEICESIQFFLRDFAELNRLTKGRDHNDRHVKWAVLDTLSEREAGVVSMRFGLTDGQPKTLDEIGKVYGVTRERIRQIESKTMSKLRHPSRSQVLRDYLD